ncbi:MAG: iron-sulfur cluster-binding domain-containing protein [Bacteroidetes bacterium]|nr:iron-sulfur cluster-binding domain-containing protein [Bacteroidota bacterium]
MDLLQLIVKKIIHETKDAITIRLETADGSNIPYEAGQFLTLIFDHDLRRSYSFSSTPGIDKYMSITVKRVQNGQVSRFLIDHVNEGTVLNSLAPSGMFTIETNSILQRQFLFITAGSGITPIYSLIKKILLAEPLSSIVLIYQNHDEKNIIFKNQLKKIETKFAGRIKWISLLTSPRKYPHQGIRLTNLLLEKLVNEHSISEREKIFYLCGPSALMRMAQFTLKLMGFTDAQIRKENFTIDFIPPPPLIDSNDPKQLVIHHQQKDYKITASYPMNILQAALNNNIRLPYSCRGGRCSTCVAKLLKGKVMMSINEVLTEKDIQNGLVLTCVGYAETDVELSI